MAVGQACGASAGTWRAEDALLSRFSPRTTRVLSSALWAPRQAPLHSEPLSGLGTHFFFVKNYFMCTALLPVWILVCHVPGALAGQKRDSAALVLESWRAELPSS